MHGEETRVSLANGGAGAVPSAMSRAVDLADRPRDPINALSPSPKTTAQKKAQKKAAGKKAGKATAARQRARRRWLKAPRHA